MSKCTVYGKYCVDHEFAHGAEAEELRRGIENALKANMIPDVDLGVADVRYLFGAFRRQLQCILDETDARDSLAYLQFNQEKEAESVP